MPESTWHGPCLLETYLLEEMLMDLTSTTSTTKRTRAKAPVAESTPKAATKKSVRPRKKVTPAIEAMPASGVRTSAEVVAMIATAAYYIAAKRNFAPGKELDDWLTAECQVLSSL
jgi:hypothetical protein